jgi:hypothetical protein
MLLKIPNKKYLYSFIHLKGVWERNVNLFYSFDACRGTIVNSQNKGEYHVRSNPICLYNSKDDSKHSPLIGILENYL